MSGNASARRLVQLCLARGMTLATAESCTGGLLAGAITAIPGASAMFETGFVTYSNEAKIVLLGVPAGLIAAAGAVSEAVARRMASGARTRSGAGLALSITGIAGPGGASATKPVGTVWFGLATAAGTQAHHRHFQGDRDAVRAASLAFALEILTGAAQNPSLFS